MQTFFFNLANCKNLEKILAKSSAICPFLVNFSRFLADFQQILADFSQFSQIFSF